MKHIISFASWAPLNENTAVAKQYVFKRAAKKLEKDPANLTDAEKKEILDKPSIKEIFELTKSHPNYSLPFVRFYFEHKAAIKSPAENPDAPSLEYLMNIIKNKKQMLSQLEHNFDYYASLKPDNGISGFERLTDELRTLERAKDAKWFVDALPKPLRDQYRTMSKEEQAKVITLAIQLKDLGESAISRLFEKIKAFSSWNIEKVIDYAANYVKGYSNLGMGKKIAEIEALEPEAGIIYSDDQYLVLSVRTENAQKKLCSVANWCINRGSFSGYAKEAVQLNIFNFGIDPSDPLFLTGTTIYYNGKVRTSHDINDTYIQKSDNPVNHFTALGYPEKLVSAVMLQFPAEVMIKKIIYDLNLDKLTPEGLLLSIIKQSYSVDPSADPTVLEVVLSIIKTRIKDAMTRQQVVSFYVKNGVLSKFSAQLLKILLDGATKTETQSILSSTLEVFKKVHAASRVIQNLPPQVKNVLAQEKDILSELGYANIKEATSSLKFIKFFEELDHDQLKSLEDYADYLFSSLGVDIVFTKHFKDRINDARNGVPITYDEMSELFRKAYQDAGHEIAELPVNTAAVLKDIMSKLNVPFKLVDDPKHGETDAMLMTVMRKKNYRSDDPSIEF